ncbi:MAG: hypothetical protein FWF99_04530 [Desulfovibrionaceae bacterium]|nr:hypothetical protein [Desulfovibrionaceae bacterium]
MSKNSGIIPGIIACVLAILGMFTIGTLFIPLAAVVALIGTLVAVKSKNIGGIGVVILAWILTIVGFALSPVLLGIMGVSMAS